MQRKTLIALAAVLASACALPAFAQETPAQTNLDPAAAQKEARNARGSQLTDVAPEQARTNALRRCDNLPAFYKNDCVARVNGQGNNQTQGSVTGGGIFVETKTSMPKPEYEKQRAESGPTQMSPAHFEASTPSKPAAHKHHKRPAHKHEQEAM
jgi:hypothetical protein